MDPASALLTFSVGVLIGIGIGWMFKRLPPLPQIPYVACPYCWQPVRREATKCHHCLSRLSHGDSAPEAYITPSSNTEE
jgi:predicted amidophosphoribosyltransferase